MDVIYYITGFLTTLGLPALLISTIVLLIKPKLINRHKSVKKSFTRKKIATIGLVGFVVAFMGFGTILAITEPASVKSERLAREAAEAKSLQFNSLEEQKRISEDATKPVVKTETKTEIIAFESTEQNDNTLPSGETKVSVEGVNGKRTITYKVTYVKNKETAREETKNEITKKPVNKVVLVGTYVKPAATPSSTYVAPAPSSSNIYYENCTAVKAAGAAPLYAGEPGYGSHLDRDHDGVACEK